MEKQVDPCIAQQRSFHKGATGIPFVKVPTGITIESKFSLENSRSLTSDETKERLSTKSSVNSITSLFWRDIFDSNEVNCPFITSSRPSSTGTFVRTATFSPIVKQKFRAISQALNSENLTVDIFQPEKDPLVLTAQSINKNVLLHAKSDPLLVSRMKGNGVQPNTVSEASKDTTGNDPNVFNVGKQAFDVIDKLVVSLTSIGEDPKKKVSIAKPHKPSLIDTLNLKHCLQHVHYEGDKKNFRIECAGDTLDEVHIVKELENLRELLLQQDQIQQEGREKLKKFEQDIQSQDEQLRRMAKIVEEYEEILQKFQSEQAQQRQQHEQMKQKLTMEKEEQVRQKEYIAMHLTNSELAFSDVHKKYERSKEIIQTIRKNEEVLKKTVTEYEEAIKRHEDRYEQLKSHATKELENANQVLREMQDSHLAETAKLKAMLKKSEIRISSLEESLQRKGKETEQLAAMCDELILKVGDISER